MQTGSLQLVEDQSNPRRLILAKFFRLALGQTVSSMDVLHCSRVSPVWASRGVLGRAGDSYDGWLETGIAGTAKLLSGWA